MLKRYFVHGVPVRELRGSRLVADVLDQDVVRTIRSFVGDSSELVAVASRSIVHLHTVGGGEILISKQWGESWHPRLRCLFSTLA